MEDNSGNKVDETNIVEKHHEIPGMFEGSVLKLLIRLSLPMFAGMMVNLLYNIVDTLLISLIDKTDESLVGGVGIVFPLLFMVIAISNGLMTGISSLVARSIGKKDHATLNKIAESGLAIAVLFAVTSLSIFWFAGKELIKLLGAEGNFYTHAVDYLYFLIPAGFAIFLNSTFTGILQGEGRMKTFMTSIAIGTIGNLILDPIFIFALGLHIKGAALATSIAQLLSTVYLFWIFIKDKDGVVRITWKLRNIRTKIIKEILAIGIPQTLGQIFMAFSILIVNKIAISIDEKAMTAFTLYGRVDQIILIPIFAIGAALVTMVGQNWGRQKFLRVKEIWKISILSTSVLMTGLAAFMFIFAPLIYSFFTQVDAVLEYAVLQTRIMEFTLFTVGITILARSFFQAVGKSQPAFFIPATRTLFLAMPFIILGVYLLQLDIFGIWYGSIAANVITAVICFFWVRRFLRRCPEKDQKQPEA